MSRAGADHFDAAIIGGGFYGAAIAAYLARRSGFKRIVLIEREPELLRRASMNNQARVHNGYHYPRSYTTAFRSRVNFPRFVADYPAAIERDFTALYAIARRNSKVTARQFTRFFAEVGAKIELATTDLQALFEPRLIEQVFLVEEYAFNSRVLAARAAQELQDLSVEVRTSTRVNAIRKVRDGLVLECAPESQITARRVFNCTYSGLNQLGGDLPGTETVLKHEIAEMPLVAVPPPLKGLGITVMDGPFFSLMPYPARELHTLSHVRYTPHTFWYDASSQDPYARLEDYPKLTRVDRMLRDASRYLPSIRESSYVDSLFEVKTVLVKSEGDDGRPILFERHPQMPECVSILGGKIDNIYDVLERMDAEDL